MKSSSPPSSSSSSSSITSTSVTAAPDIQLLSSSSPPLPHLSLRSPDLQAEFLKESQNRLLSHSDDGESSVTSPSSPRPSPFSPSSSSSLSPPVNRQARLSLSSPELLSELKKSRTRSLRHVPAHNGLTTVFCGRGGGGGAGGGQVSGPAPSTPPANQKT
ncbi:hypothetical protein VZT92_017505 [Zoarces viviparus]|uniref:Uncharacterized protein n=1 Tax=Zoarces viviparus TaxID=48416 RepID=A0AAW1ESH4_ZOAVI